MTGITQIASYFHYTAILCNDINYMYWYYLGYLVKKFFKCIVSKNLILILNLRNMMNKFKYTAIVIIHFN